jgi:hypothetical protein
LLDAINQAIRSAVVSGVYGKSPHSEHGWPVIEEIDPITEALQVASDILTGLTAYRIHPAGIAVEDFQATPSAHRLTPNYTPLRRVVSVERVSEDEIEPVTSGWYLAGDHIRFDGSSRNTWTNIICSSRTTGGERLRVTYQFGSTITASARRAVLWFAHQIWLESADCDECGECQLPGRTTSVQREGLSFTLLDPQDYLRDGKTGLPSVDLWISSTNPRKALRPAGVFTPDAPAPENISVQSVRPVWLAGSTL